MHLCSCGSEIKNPKQRLLFGAEVVVPHVVRYGRGNGRMTVTVRSG